MEADTEKTAVEVVERRSSPAFATPCYCTTCRNPFLTEAEISTLVDGLIANAKICALKSKIAAIKSHDQRTAKSMEAYYAHLDRIDRKLLSMLAHVADGGDTQSPKC